jgi:hypothetical protein
VTEEYKHQIGIGLSDFRIRNMADKMVPGEQIGTAKGFTFHRARYHADGAKDALRQKNWGPLYVAAREGVIVCVMCSRFIWTETRYRSRGLGLELWIARLLDTGYEVVTVQGRPAVISAGRAEIKKQQISPPAQKMLWKAYEAMVERGIVDPLDGQGQEQEAAQGEAPEETRTAKAGGDA